MDTITVSTHKRNEFIDITGAVRKSCANGGARNGIGVV